MSDDTLFYTRTMARVFAGQGRWDRAADIYRYLAERHPEDPELLRELAAARRAAAARRKDLAGLMERWIDLLLARRRLKGLKRLDRRAGGKADGRRDPS